MSVFSIDKERVCIVNEFYLNYTHWRSAGFPKLFLKQAESTDLTDFAETENVIFNLFSNLL